MDLGQNLAQFAEGVAKRKFFDNEYIEVCAERIDGEVEEFGAFKGQNMILELVNALRLFKLKGQEMYLAFNKCKDKKNLEDIEYVRLRIEIREHLDGGSKMSQRIATLNFDAEARIFNMTVGY